MGLELREALAIARNYVAAKPPEGTGYNVVVIRDGYLRATNGVMGCEIPCDDVDGIKLAVDCTQLASMVRAIGGDVTLKAIKGRNLQIKGAGVTYKLKAIPVSQEPDFPDIPKAGWKEITRVQAMVLSAIAGFIDTKNPNQALTGLRLTPEWCAGASRDAVAFAWISDLVDESFTTPPGIFAGVEMAGDLVVHDGRLFLRAADESIRWSLGYVVDWPDGSLSGTVVGCRSQARSVVTVDLADVGLMCRQAAVVTSDLREGFKLTMSEKRLTLEGTQGVADYSGKIGVSAYKQGVKEEFVGVRPDKLGVVCSVVASAEGDKAYLSIGGPLMPILVWNEGDVIIEAINVPMRLLGT